MDKGRHTGVSLTGEQRNGGDPAIQQIKWVISQKSKKATARKTESFLKQESLEDTFQNSLDSSSLV